MKDKITSILIALFWIGFFGYLFYKGLTAVAVLSIIILVMTMALSISSEVN